jgi:mRNA interferase RelE/StbE
MSYAVLILPRALKELSELPDSAYAHVRDVVSSLGQTPRPPQCSKLTGREGWRMRVGDYRIVYKIDDDRRTATVVHVGHRPDVYR